MTSAFVRQIASETAYMTMSRWIARMYDAANIFRKDGNEDAACLLEKERNNLIQRRDELPLEKRLYPSVFYDWKSFTV